MEREQISVILRKAGVAKRQLDERVRQIWRGTYVRGAHHIGEMEGIPARIASALSARLTLARPTILSERRARDHCLAWELEMPASVGGAERSAGPARVKSVYIPDGKRGTLCVSSQVGCTLNCRFCHTGTQPLVRNLRESEIIGQVVVAFDRLNGWRRVGDGGAGDFRPVTTVVFMGMGEPLYNLAAVTRSVRILTDPGGFAFSRRSVTVSTAGVAPRIPVLGELSRPVLAVSLHATSDALRNRLVPLNRKFPLASVLAACRRYPGLSNSNRILFEYVMLAGINDSLEQAVQLASLLKGIPAKVNLIPFNNWPGTSFRPTPEREVARFACELNAAGLAAPIRARRGEDVGSACGQLKTITTRNSITTRN